MKYITKIRQIKSLRVRTKFRFSNFLKIRFANFYKVGKSMIVTSLILFPVILIAQTPAITPITPTNPNQVEIIKADSLVGQNTPFMSVRKLMGNVALRQATTLVYCNLAILNETTNILEAYGKVKIIQADTVTITGDTAYYFGNERKAKINGREIGRAHV